MTLLFRPDDGGYDTAAGAPSRCRYCAISVLFRLLLTPAAASDRNAVAYAATRLVPCHAAVSRALMHVKEALPLFAPKSFIDFGAGPGTATMAAGSVFAASAAAFTLVEPSIAMQVRCEV